MDITEEHHTTHALPQHPLRLEQNPEIFPRHHQRARNGGWRVRLASDRDGTDVLALGSLGKLRRLAATDPAWTAKGEALDALLGRRVAVRVP